MTRHDRDAADGTRRTSRKLLHIGAIAALAIALVATGTGITFALWNSSASVESTASTAQLELTAENFSSTDFVFRNDRLSARSSVTVTNTTNTASNIAAGLKLVLDTAPGSSAALASGIAVSVWQVSTSTNCVTASPTGTIHQGTWALFPVIAQTSLLKHGEQARYCINSAAVASERSKLASTAGMSTISPRLTATLTVGNFDATAIRTATQATSYIFPATNQPAPSTWYNIVNTGVNQPCVDVNGGNGGNGTGIINYHCKNSADLNQDWGLVTTSYDPRYVNIVTRYTSGAIPKNLAIGTPAGQNTVQVQTPDTNSLDQQWQLQLRSTSGANTYQIVNRASGLCLQGNGTDSQPILQLQCDGSPSQGFTFVVRQVQAPSLAIACQVTSPGVTYSWAGPAVEEYQLQIAPLGSSTFVPLKTVPFGAESIAVIPSDVASTLATGMHTVRAIWRTHIIGSTNLWNEKAGSTPSLACKAETDVAVSAASVTPATIEAGSPTATEWKFNVTNLGTVSSGPLNVVVAVPATSGYAVASTLGSCSTAGGQAICTLSSLAPGTSAAVTVTGTVSTVALGGMPVTATVSLTGGVTDTGSANNIATGSVTVQDTTNPGKPIGLGLSGTTSNATTLTWTRASDNVGISEYHIFRNGSETPIIVQSSGTGATQSYTNTGLQPNTLYTYTVIAVDQLGLKSAHSDPASTTTANANVAPTVTCSTSSLGVMLAWESTGATRYLARWRTSNGNWSSGTQVTSGQTYGYWTGDVSIGSSASQIRIDAVYGTTTVQGSTRNLTSSWGVYGCGT